ncbi:hypothetical protein PV08_02926 [Exophiala spinifera]|uniref:F-box domain-containing protein n=1 Tax=Exophiala spinifera TaxID=91928 RepID=A0A0D2A0Y6_9EURO|nr:uncharacterized protein PV08_02926 [Exophiala spinifera]KIW18637.1 hypothetical protein PV08_02926 [Exophiala spinifera]
MSPVMIMRPPSVQTSSTTSHDDIPPQPLDPNRNEADFFHPPLTSHDFSPKNHHKPSSNGSDQQMREAIAFHKLPTDVIERILWMVEANTFASLAILNQAWYKAAQNRELYAHHLSRCPSYALSNTVITGPFRKNDLYRLKTKFAAEVRRNLFEAYLRPRQTLINLISVSASSSAALPGAEAFRFAFSPNGQCILALSSSRIYVIDAITEPVSVTHELKTLRRPLAASVTDDGTTLAVLSSKHQANIYNLSSEGVQHVQVIVMDNPPRTIALAPQGTVLAAAYDGGVEVFSLAPTALSTDRRAVRSEGVDTLSFSGDGSMLYGSTQSLEEPSAVVITAPFYTENDLPPKEVHSRMWTTQILFPQLSSVCSHAELMQGHTEGDASWLFAYDHSLMSYRAVRTDDTRTGVAYFLNPTTNRRFSIPAPSTAPTATACGTLVVAGFSGAGLWIYGVPERLDVSPDMGSVVERHEQRLQGQVALTSATGHLEPLMAYSPSVSGSSEEIEEDSLAAKVDWRESLFVKCAQIRSLDGCTAAKWVERCEVRECAFPGKRLVAVAPGGVDQFVEELGDETMPVDGSRVSILDFEYGPSSGQDREITIEVGEKEPALLTEQIGDMDIEVAIERRRSVRDRGRGTVRMPLGRSVTTVSANQSWNQRRTNNASSPASSPLDVDAQMDLANASSRAPKQPPSNLHRSMTAAGFAAARYPPRPPLAFQDNGQLVYHRSPVQQWQSGEGWETPPPPYSGGFPSPVPLGPSLGPPLAQPRPNRSPGQPPMPLAGIPENNHIPQHSQAFIYQPGYGQGPISSSHQARFSDQPHQISHSTHMSARENTATPAASGIPRSMPSGYLAVQPPNSDQHTSTNQARTSPPHQAFASTISAESSSRPVSQSDRSSPHYTPERERVPALNISEPEPAPFEAMAVLHHSQRPSDSGSFALTGANHQGRLNHTIPPTPTTLDQTRNSQYVVTGPPPPPKAEPAPVSSPASGYIVALPTADQMANLDRRISQTARKPVPSTNGAALQNHSTATMDFSRPLGVSPSPPRGAWGAAGVANAPSFNKASATPNGLVRNNSRGSGRDVAMSSSTPNLLASYPQRPAMSSRLHTIESVSTAYGPGEPGSRSHSISGQMVLPDQMVLGSSFAQGISAYQEMRSERGDGSNTSRLSRARTRKSKNKKGESLPDHRRSQTVPADSPSIGRKEKGSRCVVM